MSSAPDYTKMKNAELEALLRERSLPSGGKKADMVARLVEADKSASSATAATAAPASTKPPAAPAATATAKAAADEDQIQWDDDAAGAATTDAAAAAIEAGGAGERVANPTAVPNQEQAVDPAKTHELTSSGPAASNTADYASGLAATDLDAELAKRKARAAKFGIAESESDAIKALERAKRFGTGTAGEKKAGEEAVGEAGSGVSRLDQALPERSKGRKRGPPGESGFEDEGLKRRRGGGGGGFRGRRRGGGGVREGRVEKSGGGNSWMSEADRAAAEKRKAKFGA